MAITVARAGDLFDYAVACPNGFEARQACRELNLNYHQFGRAVRALRKILADDDINLICKGQGFGQPSRFELVGDLLRAGPWVSGRLRSLESQLETVLNVSTSLMNGSDGRTIEGKKARLINRHVGRLVEDLGDLDGQLPLRSGSRA